MEKTLVTSEYRKSKHKKQKLLKVKVDKRYTMQILRIRKSVWLYEYQIKDLKTRSITRDKRG